MNRTILTALVVIAVAIGLFLASMAVSKERECVGRSNPARGLQPNCSTTYWFNR